MYFMSGYTSIKIDTENLEELDKCVTEYRRHHPELDKIPISRNKIIYEIAKYYLR